MQKSEREGKLRTSEHLRLAAVHKLQVNDQLTSKLQTELVGNEESTRAAVAQGLEELQELEKALDQKNIARFQDSVSLLARKQQGHQGYL